MIRDFREAVEEWLDEQIAAAEKSNAGLKESVDDYRGKAHQIKAFQYTKQKLPEIERKFMTEDDD